MIGIHPGSSVERGMIEKRWPLENFAELINTYQGNAKFLIFIGPEEKELIRIKDLADDTKIIIVKDLGLRNEAALISKCSAFVSNDSGLMHISAACDVPTIGIFLTSDPRRTYPYGRGSKVITTNTAYLHFRQNLERLCNYSCDYPEEVEEISVEKVSQTLQKI